MNNQHIEIKEVDLDYFIEAVEGNNEINGGNWSQWASGKEIIDVYTDFGDTPYLVTFIDGKDYIESELDRMILEGKTKQ
ncbi:TPA: hypothetical protein SL763_005068 [Pseudomonas aeruginosa]|nr:hypothetical protein [Pseudomonas aeruginosa]